MNVFVSLFKTTGVQRAQVCRPAAPSITATFFNQRNNTKNEMLSGRTDRNLEKMENFWSLNEEPTKDLTERDGAAFQTTLHFSLP